MSELETMQPVPLTTTIDGTIRISGTRVSLASVLHHFHQGATADEIAIRFPSLRLADIHSCIAYYLNHTREMDALLHAEADSSKQLREAIQSDQAQAHATEVIRLLLLSGPQK